MQIDNETLRWLGALADIAARFNLPHSADRIADALLAAAPDDPEAQVVTALTKLNSRRPEECVKILHDKVLAKDPDHEGAKGFLVLAYDMMGQTSERDRLAKDVIENGNDPLAKQIAEQALAG